jgi:Arf-GAP/SH3 domain/ANK repeat/PH domain-containing protein
MRTKMKKVLKKAEAAQLAQVECNEAMTAFMTALREASLSNANAIQPALEHYFEKIARQILLYEKQNTTHLQKLIIEPLSRLYNFDIKQAEAKKKDFEDESRDYYAYLSRYLGQRQDSLKEKKRVESDSKYQTKRRNFELRRFDYSSFMQDLHGGRKEQEVLSQLTKYADTQTRGYLSTAKKIEEMLPQLDALVSEVKTADKEFQFQRTEREEKRRLLETSTRAYVEPEPSTTTSMSSATPANTNGISYVSDSELGRSDSTSSQLKGSANGNLAPTTSNTSTLSPQQSNGLSVSPGNNLGSSPGSNKFKGIRDLEEKDPSQIAVAGKMGGQLRKEGLLWALSRPGSHIDPKGINKQAWHK